MVHMLLICKLYLSEVSLI